MDLVQELQKTVDELAGAPGRPSRSNGGQHHAVVTPRVEASPDRSDFAKLGETIALEQTKQFADDIRSQVAEKSRELAEMNERLMAFGDCCWPRLGVTHALVLAGQNVMRCNRRSLCHDVERCFCARYPRNVSLESSIPAFPTASVTEFVQLRRHEQIQGGRHGQG